MWQALLSRLYTVGPVTDGIFRKSASLRKTREVKEQLEAGNDVDFTDVSVFVCAAILKVCNAFLCLPVTGVTIYRNGPQRVKLRVTVTVRVSFFVCLIDV